MPLPMRLLVVCLALMETACAMSNQPPSRAPTVQCALSGESARRFADKANPAVPAEDACTLLRREVAAGLGTADRTVEGLDIAIALDLSRAGTAKARVSYRQGSAAHDFPEIAVDVLDRQLERADLTRLSEEIVRQVTQELAQRR
jgi:hypothetical protein